MSNQPPERKPTADEISAAFKRNSKRRKKARGGSTPKKVEKVETPSSISEVEAWRFGFKGVLQGMFGMAIGLQALALHIYNPILPQLLPMTVTQHEPWRRGHEGLFKQVTVIREYMNGVLLSTERGEVFTFTHLAIGSKWANLFVNGDHKVTNNTMKANTFIQGVAKACLSDIRFNQTGEQFVGGSLVVDGQGRLTGSYELEDCSNGLKQ